MAIRIYIDQGHNPTGSNYSGAQAGGLYESEINYIVGIYLRDLLVFRGGFDVMVSRETPTFSLGENPIDSLQKRVSMANSWPADYFVSIHCNANVSPFINGTEVYIYRYPSEAAVLAANVLNEVVEIVGTRDNGVRTDPELYVLRKTTMPAILIEMAYLTNPRDARLLKNNVFEFAYAIYIGILRFLGLPPL